MKTLTEQSERWSGTSWMQKTEHHNPAVPRQYDSGTCLGQLSQMEFPSQCVVQ